MSRKIGLWSVMALVAGSQIGSSTLMQPAILAPYGSYGLWGWIIAGTGAISLALVFAQLCCYLPKTGGPHAYANSAFGRTFGFFTGWTYWIISWISNTAVIVTAVAYMTPLIGKHPPEITLAIEIIILLLITAINLKGIVAAGITEFFLTVLKLLPLIVIPIFAFFEFDYNNFTVSSEVASLPLSKILSSVVLSLFWGFIGVEVGTTPAESVVDPSKTIPKAIVWGTLCVVAVYLINSISMLGLIPGDRLANLSAPYVEAAQILFGGSWGIAVSLVAAIVCIGTLNSWVLSSGQVSLGLAQDGFLPPMFAKKNAKDSPYFGLLVSFLGTVPFLILTNQESLCKQLLEIIDVSVTSFLFVYLVCCLACLRFFVQRRCFSPLRWSYTLFATIFCIWEIASTPADVILLASLFTLSGVPGYLIWYRRKLTNKNRPDQIQTGEKCGG